MIGTIIWMKMMIILVLVIKIAREDDTNNKDNDTGPPIPGGGRGGLSPPTFLSDSFSQPFPCNFAASKL